MLAVRVEWLDFARGICTIPPDVRKGRRKWGVYHLWPELVPLLKECLAADPTRELVWPWDRCAGSYYTSYNRILRDAEIPVSRKTKTHGLRVSHATWLKGCTRPAFAGPLQPAELPPFPPRLRPRPSAIRNPTRPPVLVLSRHRDEAIVIADNIKITVVEIRGDKVRLGIDAPKDISVHRQEVYAEIQRGRAGSSEESASPGRP